METRQQGALIERPDRDGLRALALQTPGARMTRHGGVAVETSVRRWACDTTFLVARNPGLSSHRAVARPEAARIAAMQETYAATRPMIALDGAIGAGPACSVPVRMYIERRWAALAAVQQLLYFEPAVGRAPCATVIWTPGLRVPGYRDGRVVTVDLEGSVTRICGTDFFGEAKRAGLRMWSKRAWEQGGLPLHSAAVSAGPVATSRRIALLVGRPGTGKSTLVFADGIDGVACQEDRVAWLRDGSLMPAERAFFSPASLGAGWSTKVRDAVREPGSCLLNPPGGRVVFRDRGVDAAAIAGERPSVVILLARNQNVLPAVVRVDRELAAATYVAALRGSETGRSAAQRLGANPLLPLSSVAQGARLLELLERHDTETYVMNTGRVGGPDERPGSRDIEPRHSAAIVAALLRGGVEWQHERSLGCDVARSVPGLDATDSALLRPAELYRRQQRAGEHDELAQRLTRRWAQCACSLTELGAAVAA